MVLIVLWVMLLVNCARSVLTPTPPFVMAMLLAINVKYMAVLSMALIR